MFCFMLLLSVIKVNVGIVVNLGGVIVIRIGRMGVRRI